MSNKQTQASIAIAFFILGILWGFILTSVISDMTNTAINPLEDHSIELLEQAIATRETNYIERAIGLETTK